MAVEKTKEDQSQKVPVQPTAHVVEKKKVSPPSLKHGEHLTRDEFERRYEAIPHLKKAELIEGAVYMGSPVRTDIHGKPHGYTMAWIGVYCAATPGVDFSDNATVHLDLDNEVQPDALLRIDEGGASLLSDKGYIEGTLELIVEIAGTSATICTRN